MQQKLWYFHICKETALRSLTVISVGGDFLLSLLLLALTPGACHSEVCQHVLRIQFSR